ncbi:MAG: hypothetical protein V2I66_08075 [Halieaceae bacterium]|jgi:hypothetical protein|nr:hypothetical protein [Halieaceae bacterium]
MTSLLLLLFITVNGVTYEIERPVQEDIYLLGLPDDVISVLNSEPCEAAGKLLAEHLRNRYANVEGLPLEISWRCDEPLPPPAMPAPHRSEVSGDAILFEPAERDLDRVRDLNLPEVGPPNR